MTKKKLSIYVHIPFCLSKCKYCSFYSEVHTSDYVTEYFNALKDTATYFSGLTDEENTIIETVYFGGGTPTVVDSALLCDLLQHLKNCFNFSPSCEITVESNPKTVTEAYARDLKESGFNRISLGIQTTSDERLKLLGRAHSFSEAKEAYYIYKNAGFDNISVDLMYALPYTTNDDVAVDVKRILELSPKHISTYALSLEEGTSLFSQREKYVFPDEDKQTEMYLSICDTLSKNGYSHYEISNFSIDGFESKHNLGYWERREYIGLGANAHSFWNNKRFFSKPDTQLFIKSVKNKDFISASGLDEATDISERDKIEEEIMLSLRTSKGIKVTFLSPMMNKLIDADLATYQNGYLSLTDKGFFVSNSIIYYLCKELLYDKE